MSRSPTDVGFVRMLPSNPDVKPHVLSFSFHDSQILTRGLTIYQP